MVAPSRVIRVNFPFALLVTGALLSACTQSEEPPTDFSPGSGAETLFPIPASGSTYCFTGATIEFDTELFLVYGHVDVVEIASKLARAKFRDRKESDASHSLSKNADFLDPLRLPDCDEFFCGSAPGSG